jgi:hypothetical protein
VVVPPTCCPAGHDYGDGGWVGQRVGVDDAVVAGEPLCVRDCHERGQLTA